MLLKFFPPFILTVRIERQLFSALPSPTFIRSPSNGKVHEDASLRPITPYRSGRMKASMEISEATNVAASHSGDSFCPNISKVAAKLKFLPEGRQVHLHIVKLGYYHCQSLQNHLLSFYLRCKAFADANRLFDEMLERNVVSWNTMISGAVRCDPSSQSSNNLSLFYFRKMLAERVEPNHITFIGLLRTCTELDDIESGKQLHSFILKLRFNSNCFVNTALVDLYAKCTLVDDARRVFDNVLLRDLVCWNVMVSCYALNGKGEEAFGIFRLMQSEGVNGDDFTFTSLLNACGILGSFPLGKQLHGFIYKMSFDLDVFVASALVDMYAKTGSMEDAHKTFDGMIIQNLVSWTTMIVGYGHHGDGKEAMKLLKRMIQEYFMPDELTYASILSSCANLAATCEIFQVHAHLLKRGFGGFLSIGNSLVNAYSKCGNIAGAFQSFNSILEPNLFTWTSMIGASAFHGLSREAIQLFETMLSKGVRPDRIAFLGVLSACSHGGLVDEGFHYFTSMIRDYQISPDSEHYTCLVDLLGRAGHLDEAYNVLINMPNEPSCNVLGAFIGACKIHKNVGLAKWAAERLFKLEPDDPVNYTIMSNLYASVGHWIDVARTRKTMREKCGYKMPGCSWMEVGGEVHTFVSSDKSHHQAPELYAMLHMLLRVMKEEDYAYNVDFLLHPV
ncbi:PREDICTED: pentatricopeptide repeat-containing protein At2g46050, mitochondrial [Nelumbo nucifera]|uniref:Pentatricopeptide repeat-containing protein At2g46050, mitochondrial n=2 Tax=Nelumbo nucifera TaxID=4432 RepID=A0A1U8B7W1_NELNU|nr:PREDICTED: pentatricopeptide repeat-containing protein At2g46050, mitochondrial [Nelumbo nucifera]XP_010275675.1 PREDICTED: pentatricopeptide repeat-containing protein At2g46050, mitochondrial [Nelumbo nucifera]XP_010275676.1 PREDICTED: pentatricopeptide repeat-containing protein At2g46050, mitochondrial [Nelumbo nucifera]XP_010275677.1 PREDICTED: pentatricopeptide repeat-containing protein At2g46050, mitochondrial [Nelumbo nucifera]XP_010275678.1 PREDICTED: pentatricopeptide repeat-containi